MSNKEETKQFVISPISGEELGHPIKDKLSDLLRRYTDKNDRADVSVTTNVGTSTIRGLVFRNNSLTESNSKALIELIKIALERCKKINTDSEKDELDLFNYLKKK